MSLWIGNSDRLWSASSAVWLKTSLCITSGMVKPTALEDLEPVPQVAQNIISDLDSAADRMGRAAEVAEAIERHHGALILARQLGYEKVEEATGKLNSATAAYLRQIVTSVVSFLIYKDAFLSGGDHPVIDIRSNRHLLMEAYNRADYYGAYLNRVSKCETAFMMNVVKTYLFPALLNVSWDPRSQSFLKMFDRYAHYGSSEPLSEHERQGSLERLLIENVHAVRELLIGGLQAYAATPGLTDDQYSKIPDLLERQLYTLGLPARMTSARIMEIVLDMRGISKLTPLTRIRPGALLVDAANSLRWRDSTIYTWANRPQHCVAYSAYAPAAEDEKLAFKEMTAGEDAIASLDMLFHLGIEVGIENILSLSARSEMGSVKTRLPAVASAEFMGIDLPAMSPMVAGAGYAERNCDGESLGLLTSL
jgi:hypothetical protein